MLRHKRGIKFGNSKFVMGSWSRGLKCSLMAFTKDKICKSSWEFSVYDKICKSSWEFSVYEHFDGVHKR